MGNYHQLHLAIIQTELSTLIHDKMLITIKR